MFTLGKVRNEGPLCTNKLVENSKGHTFANVETKGKGQIKLRYKCSILKLAQTQGSHHQALLALALPFLAMVFE